MSSGFLLIADALVAVLLIVTIATSVRLSRRISTLRSDEQSMRSTIGDLMAATDSAERAVAGLRTTLGECDRALVERIGIAERQTEKLTKAIQAGESVMGGIGHIVDSTRRAVQAHGRGRPPPATAEPDAGRALRSALAAAQAVADRSARRIEGRAA